MAVFLVPVSVGLVDSNTQGTSARQVAGFMPTLTVSISIISDVLSRVSINGVLSCHVNVLGDALPATVNVLSDVLSGGVSQCSR